MSIYPRISARRGNEVRLDLTFYRGGVPTDPYAIREVKIYKTRVLDSNLVAQILVVDPEDTNYPSPVSAVEDSGTIVTGKYELLWDVPSDAHAPDVYFDVWRYIPTNPCSLGEFADSTACTIGDDNTGSTYYIDLDSDEISGLIQESCNRFWVYDDIWDSSDNLSSMQIGFEPLSQKFAQPEVRPLEVGIMPLPLYQYDFNFNVPKLPMLTATISIETARQELIVDADDMEIGIRQGYYRSNPFVFRYMIDTMNFLKGTYKYRITVTLPDGTTRTGGDYILEIR